MMYALFLFFTFAVLLFVFYHMQHFMMFSPTYSRSEELDDDFEILNIIADDGTKLEGVVYEPEQMHRKLADTDSTLLFFGGRSQDSVGLIKKLSTLYPHTRIIAFNYRSYGKSDGVLNEKNMLEDGLKIAEIIERNYGNFYILGFSLGSGVASYIASKVYVKGVFLISPFESIALLIKNKYGCYIPWFLKHKLEINKFVKNIDSKTYVFASKHDEVIYVHNTRNLKESVKNLTLYKELENLSHRELLWDKKVVDEINNIIYEGVK
ncbi:MAG: alpha/beta hydrolase [Sulfurimonas sp.]|nr:alpha/beta hydrolase [Sulfurimonas sp.]